MAVRLLGSHADMGKRRERGCSPGGWDHIDSPGVFCFTWARENLQAKKEENHS